MRKDKTIKNKIDALFSSEFATDSLGSSPDDQHLPLVEKKNEESNAANQLREKELENIQLVKEMERRTRELAVLNELSRSLTSRLSTSQIAKVIFEFTERLMEVVDFFVAYYNPETEVIDFAYLFLNGQVLEPFSRPVGNTMTDYIIRKGEALLFSEDVANQMKAIGLEIVTVGDDRPALSWLGVPIIYEKEVLGVISLQTTEKSGLYTPRDRDMLMAISRQSAVAIHNALILQHLEKNSTDLETIARLSTTVSAILDPGELLQTVVDQAKERFGLYHAHIYLTDPEGKNLVLAAGAGQVGKIMMANKWGIDIGNQTSLVARSARERLGVTVNDVSKVTDFLPNPLLPDTCSEMAIPLLSADKLLGVLDVQSNSIRTFTAEDVSIFTSLAAQIAVALQNARQYSETQSALQQADMLYKGSDRVIRAQDPQMLLEAVVESASSNEIDQAFLIYFDRPWIDKPPDYLKVEGAWNSQTKGLERPKEDILDHHEISLLGILNPNEPTVIPDIIADARVNPGLRDFFVNKLGMMSMVLFPLVAGGQLIGVITAQSAEPTKQLTESSIRQIDSLAGQAATVLQSQKLQANLQLQISELENLQRMLSREAWSSYLAREERLNWGYEFDHIEVRPLEPVYSVNDRASGKQKLSASLEVRGEMIGSLGIVTDENNQITNDELDFLHSVAEQVSQALERARLFEQTQRSALELQTVAQVSSTSSALLEPNELLQSVVDLAKNSFSLYHAHIYLLDETAKKLVLNSGSGDIGRQMVEEGWTILLEDESIVARAARTRMGQIVANVLEAPDYMSNPLLPYTKSELAVPMVVGSKLLGIFDFQSDKPNQFSEEDLQTFSTLASQTAVALQNARLYAEQSTTLERLRELDLLKTSFLANMSHELRTPLNSILGFTQVILEGIDGPLSDYMVSDLQLIEKNGKHLLNLINEVLDMAKIESGKMSLTIESVDLHELLHEILEINSAQARDKLITLSLETDLDEPLVIEADQMRLRQIMINLVGNAIKFTENGGVTIRTRKVQDEVHILVEDTGIGILVGNLEKIFEAFSQVDTSTTRKVGGTGLGLPISRKLVELHGGRLWAESEGLGKGVRMHLELPIRGAVS